MPRIDPIRRTASVVLIAAAQALNAQVPSTTGYLPVDSSRVWYEECGTGPNLVLLHDGVMGAATWDEVWRDLCTKFRVIRYDRRGVGRSSAAKAPFSPRADLAALLAARSITSATFVGSSSGGALAIDFALENPTNVERLVLLGPILRGFPLTQHFIQREAANLEPARRGDIQAAAAKQAEDRYMLAPTHDKARQKVSETILANPHNLTGPRVPEIPLTAPAVSRLTEVRVPTLLLVGEFDIPDVHAHAGAIELGVSGSQREVMREAGHLIQLDQPSALAVRLAAFIDDTPVARVAASRLEGLVGTYSPVAADRPATFTIKDGRLIVLVSGLRDTPLFAANDSTFYALTASRFRVMFRRNARGSATSVDVSVSGVTHRATRQ